MATSQIIILAINAAKIEYATQLNQLNIVDFSLIFSAVSTPKNLEIKVATDVTIIRTLTDNTITWPAAIAWNGGSAPSLSNDPSSNTRLGAGQVFNLVTADGGTTWYGYEEVNNTNEQPNTMFAVGNNGSGSLAQNNLTQYSSPVQVPGTTWNKADAGTTHTLASKTDGTLWTWGSGSDGALGVPSIGEAARSSPIQIGSDTEWTGDIQANYYMSYAIQKDETP